MRFATVEAEGHAICMGYPSECLNYVDANRILRGTDVRFKFAVTQFTVAVAGKYLEEKLPNTVYVYNTDGQEGPLDTLRIDSIRGDFLDQIIVPGLARLARPVDAPIYLLADLFAQVVSYHPDKEDYRDDEEIGVTICCMVEKRLREPRRASRDWWNAPWRSKPHRDSIRRYAFDLAGEYD